MEEPIGECKTVVMILYSGLGASSLGIVLFKKVKQRVMCGSVMTLKF